MIENEVKRNSKGKRESVRSAESTFKKIRRQLRAIQRAGQLADPELGQELIRLDDFLTHRTSYWRSHFGFRRDYEI